MHVESGIDEPRLGTYMRSIDMGWRFGETCMKRYMDLREQRGSNPRQDALFLLGLSVGLGSALAFRYRREIGMVVARFTEKLWGPDPSTFPDW